MGEVESKREHIAPDQKPRVVKQHARKKQQKLYPAYYNAERKLISYMLYDATIAERMKHRLGASFNVDVHKVIVTHLYAYYEAGHPADVSQFIERIEDPEIKNLIIELAMQSLSPEVTEDEINDYVYMIQSEQGDKALIKDLFYQQKQAELDKDYTKAAEVGMEIVKIKKRLKESLRE
jgi:DNA primase